MQSVAVVYYRERNHWIARALSVEVSSSGDTLEEARAAIREALELYFEDNSEETEGIEDALLETLIV